MEIWGLCESCDRWFYCDGWFDKSRPEPTCPVCARPVVAIENRAHARMVQVGESATR